MKIFADTADVNEIRRLASMGLVDGVTTNDSLVAKTGREFADVVKEICEIVDGPISAEVISTDAKGMIAERGGSAVQVELSCLADPSIGAVLTGRGYGLQGFENVLGRALPVEPVPAA